MILGGSFARPSKRGYIIEKDRRKTPSSRQTSYFEKIRNQEDPDSCLDCLTIDHCPQASLWHGVTPLCSVKSVLPYFCLLKTLEHFSIRPKSRKSYYNLCLGTHVSLPIPCQVLPYATWLLPGRVAEQCSWKIQARTPMRISNVLWGWVSPAVTRLRDSDITRHWDFGF